MGNNRPRDGSAGFPACCIAGFQTCERSNNSHRYELPMPCRLGSRRYSRFGNLRYKERRFHLGIQVERTPHLAVAGAEDLLVERARTL